jgi:hypothetical protein
VTVAPEEAERIAPNHLAALKLCLAWAEGWIGVEPARETRLTAAVGAGAEPSQRNRLINALVTIAPIEFKALLLAEDTNRDGCPLCCFLHKEILGFAGKRQMSGYDDANQWGY